MKRLPRSFAAVGRIVTFSVAPALVAAATAMASCGGTASTSPLADAATPTGPDGSVLPRDASADGNAPTPDSGSTPDSGVTPDAAASVDGGSGPPCNSPSDCRAYSNHCDTCRCEALGADWTDPVCPGSPVTCLVDPCQGKRAACESNRCVIR